MFEIYTRNSFLLLLFKLLSIALILSIYFGIVFYIIVLPPYIIPSPYIIPYIIPLYYPPILSPHIFYSIPAQMLPASQTNATKQDIEHSFI